MWEVIEKLGPVWIGVGIITFCFAVWTLLKGDDDDDTTM